MRGMTVTYWHSGNKLRSYFGDAASQELYHEFQILRNGAGQIIASFDPQCVLGIEDHNEPLAAKEE